MPKIKSAPDGERTSIDGTEALPLSSSDSVSSWWTPISRIAEYIRTLTQTLTGKTINLSNNTLTGTTAQFNTANSDGDFATLAGSENLTNKTLTTPAISGAITFPDDVTQTFNPGTNNAGLNVGSLAGDPATPDNGDMWYDSLANELTARINGSNVALGSGSGSVATDTIWDAKGDLAAGTGANTASRLPGGTDGQVLTYDSAETTGMKWATGGAGITMDQADPYGLHHRLTGSDSDDDEFSTNTIANYTEVDPTGSTTWVITHHVASCVFNDQQSGDVGALLRAMTLADGEAFETCLTLTNKNLVNVALAGLVVTDGTGTTANALAVQCYLDNVASELMVDVRTGTLSNLVTVATSYTLAATSIIGKLRMRLKRNSSSSFTGLLSTIDGAQFDTFGLGNANPGFTPTHAGLIVSIGGGASHVCMAAFDYIRIV